MRIAVIGAGVMGTNHARVAGTLPDVELTHVVDADAERAAAAASAHGAIAVTDPLSVIGQVDAAIVALPTLLHAEVAVPCSNRASTAWSRNRSRDRSRTGSGSSPQLRPAVPCLPSDTSSASTRP
ncbi:MAG: Gfo/Idh/MocA family oxidoreductase [Microthrixaceae bacterium]